MFKGSIVALVTPMLDNGDIDWDSFASLIEWHVESGTDAIVAVGTTGESATVNTTEHKAALRFTVEQAAGRIPIIAGAGGNATAEAIELSLAAQEAGCAATLQVVPYYNKPPQRGLYAHFKAIAEAVALPHLLYNVPGRTSCDLLPETVVALAKISNIVGIKEASNMERMLELRACCPAGFTLLCGEDALSAEALCHGTIDGVISVTANLMPQLMHEMVAAGLNGDYDRCRAINNQLAPLHDAMFFECNPLPVKWALHRLGKIGSTVRLPLVPLAVEKQAEVEAAMQSAVLI
ncbi:MAG: 4-hydroxy-tetrahydrodipicolinate synthase [Cardiobacteriaceae bacterium]|nr:4-hydroxy-tetrahydrodipicolinate synthase [Cardiobacteriaceae bacterium]